MASFLFFCKSPTKLKKLPLSDPFSNCTVNTESNPGFVYINVSNQQYNMLVLNKITPQKLKGLSLEIDFKNFDKNLQNLA